MRLPPLEVGICQVTSAALQEPLLQPGDCTAATLVGEDGTETTMAGGEGTTTRVTGTADGLGGLLGGDAEKGETGSNFHDPPFRPRTGIFGHKCKLHA